MDQKEPFVSHFGDRKSSGGFQKNPPQKTLGEVSKMSGESKMALKRGKAINTSGDPDLIAAVKAGRETITGGANLLHVETISAALLGRLPIRLFLERPPVTLRAITRRRQRAASAEPCRRRGVDRDGAEGPAAMVRLEIEQGDALDLDTIDLDLDTIDLDRDAIRRIKLFANNRIHGRASVVEK